jgi:transporter family protein
VGIPAWLAYSLLTIVAWGAWGIVSKIVSDRIDANTNQVYFSLGLLPLMLAVHRSPRFRAGERRTNGAAWAFLTGILGGTGNIAFFHALVIGGQASMVVPATALYPLVTVILAALVLREKMRTTQQLGLALALAAIYLLSM